MMKRLLPVLVIVNTLACTALRKHPGMAFIVPTLIGTGAGVAAKPDAIGASVGLAVGSLVGVTLMAMALKLEDHAEARREEQREQDWWRAQMQRAGSLRCDNEAFGRASDAWARRSSSECVQTASTCSTRGVYCRTSCSALQPDYNECVAACRDEQSGCDAATGCEPAPQILSYCR
jgi:hypothetical protein